MDTATPLSRAEVARIAARVPPRRPGGGPGREAIAAAVAAIAERFRPERVVLFGSRASGRPRPDSDVDLLVVMETPERPLLAAVRIRQALLGIADFPLDVLVRTPEEIRLGLDEGDFFVTDVMTNGTVLFEAGDAAVDRQS